MVVLEVFLVFVVDFKFALFGVRVLGKALRVGGVVFFWVSGVCKRIFRLVGVREILNLTGSCVRCILVMKIFLVLILE